MASKELKEYLENGNIINSVNYPSVSLNKTGNARITVLHKNTSNMVGSITAAIASSGENISGMINASKGDYAYTLVVADSIPDVVINALNANEDIIKVRKI
jgi:D-3-phosphoglycerate dehydrogenase